MTRFRIKLADDAWIYQDNCTALVCDYDTAQKRCAPGHIFVNGMYVGDSGTVSKSTLCNAPGFGPPIVDVTSFPVRISFWSGLNAIAPDLTEFCNPYLIHNTVHETDLVTETDGSKSYYLVPQDLDYNRYGRLRPKNCVTIQNPPVKGVKPITTIPMLAGALGQLAPARPAPWRLGALALAATAVGGAAVVLQRRR